MVGIPSGKRAGKRRWPGAAAALLRAAAVVGVVAFVLDPSFRGRHNVGVANQSVANANRVFLAIEICAASMPRGLQEAPTCPTEVKIADEDPPLATLFKRGADSYCSPHPCVEVYRRGVSGYVIVSRAILGGAVRFIVRTESWAHAFCAPFDSTCREGVGRVPAIM